MVSQIADISEKTADDALWAGEITGIIATVHENERPLSGLAGLIDWRFHGIISEKIKSGAITGSSGEVVYYPAKLYGKLYHLILVGAGTSEGHGKRAPLPEKTIKVLKKNLLGLNINGLALSRFDFGNPSLKEIRETFKGVALCVTD